MQNTEESGCKRCILWVDERGDFLCTGYVHFLGLFLEYDGVIKGDVDTWGFNSESDQGSGSRFGGKAKAGPNGSMVKFCEGNMIVDAQF